MKENDKSGREKWGRRVLYGGIIAGVLGLVLLSPELIVGGGALAAGGLIFESSNNKPKRQTA